MANESRLVLPKPMMAKLASLGIYCQTWVTAERQDRAKRWVLRGVESGGSAKEFGRYISFFAADGSRMEWLQKADRIGANGVHAVVIGEGLVGVEMARVDETYQLVISRHQLGKPKAEGKRPPVESSVIFRGVDGQLSRSYEARAGARLPDPERRSEGGPWRFPGGSKTRRRWSFVRELQARSRISWRRGLCRNKGPCGDGGSDRVLRNCGSSRERR